MNGTFAKVHILDAPYSVDKLYTYCVPEYLSDCVKDGSIVSVPFGKGDKSAYAVVFEKCGTTELENVKSITDCHEQFVLDDEMLKMCVFLKERTFCTIGDAVKSIVPFSAVGKIAEYYSVCQGITSDDDIFLFLKEKGEKSLDVLEKNFGKDVKKNLRRLCLEKIITRRIIIKESDRKTEKYYSFGIDDTVIEKILQGEKNCKLRSEKQLSVIEALKENGKKLSESELKGITGANSTHFNALVEKGILKEEKTVVTRDPYKERASKKDENILTPHQKEAFAKIKELLDTNEPKAVLLHGITGSGKTRVIKSAIDAVLEKGKQAIVLVPEISLTPQTVGLFKGYYGDRVAVIHSSLSGGERYDAFLRMKEGQTDVCIGTRSAVFAPFERLGLIVIDEEQEHTYKSDMSPRYHVRDVAGFRCAYHDSLMLLSSATPSLESYYKAEKGNYTLVELNERYGGAVLPETLISDLRLELETTTGLSTIGETLYTKLKETLERHEQAILFINRRGYNNMISCHICGETVKCPHCSVSMTFHSPGRVYERDGENETKARIRNGWMTCHYCGARIKVPSKCPECGSEHLQFLGFGTQRVEDELKKLFPSARIMRMDADTTSSKFAYDDMLDRFRNKQADILLGTQMVTKGHDFPDVTCVGIILADTSLYLDDYRAAERTFDMITQVTGRAGRAGKKGCAVIQTYNPVHQTLIMAQSQSYQGFYKNEINVRKAYVFPPFCDMMLITLSGLSESEVLESAVFVSTGIKKLQEEKYNDVALTFYGPFEAPIYRLNEKYRMQCVIKCKNNKRTRQLFAEEMCECTQKYGRKIQITFDINPNSI